MRGYLLKGREGNYSLGRKVEAKTSLSYNKFSKKKQYFGLKNRSRKIKGSCNVFNLQSPKPSPSK